MLNMYKNMHYIYINMYTMCKTYGIQRTRGMAWVVEMERRLSHIERCKSTDGGGEARCFTCAYTNVLRSEMKLLH